MVLNVFVKFSTRDRHLGGQPLVFGFSREFALQLRKAEAWSILAFEVILQQDLIPYLDCKFPFIPQGVDNPERVGTGI
jgi:hypothetical protein